MAPTRTVRSKHVSKGSNKPSSSSKTRPSSSSPAKSRISKKPKLPPSKQQKTKSSVSLAKQQQKKKNQKSYKDEELGIPKLNMVTPVGVGAPKGKKKGKIFVDDAESMMTILAIVNADKEGHIESKMMKNRQMEEIREARKREAENKQAIRKEKLEETKEAMRKKRKRKVGVDIAGEEQQRTEMGRRGTKEGKKRVSFAS
ncbi:MAG: hypothetical protein Q9217_005074 [Psora testacea]